LLFDHVFMKFFRDIFQALSKWLFIKFWKSWFKHCRNPPCLQFIGSLLIYCMGI